MRQNVDVEYGGFSARSTKGSVLVAVPILDEPTFHRTVIYMLQHNDEGALGVVLNRPTDEDSLPGLDSWMYELSHPQVVFDGGPVQGNALIAVAALTDDAESDAFAALDDKLGTVDLERLPSEVAEGLQNLRVFRGYSGWGPGQLEAELARHDWFTEPEDPKLIFDGSVEAAFALWTREPVAVLIERKTTKRLSLKDVGRYLASWGMSSRRPARCRAPCSAPAAARARSP